MKLAGVIDLGNLSKSCHRLKIPRCLLLGDFGVTRAKRNHKFSPFFSGTVRRTGLKFFLGLLRTNRGACFFFFENCLLNTPGEAKYLRHYQKPCFFSIVRVFQRLPYLIEIRSWRKKKHAPRFVRSSSKKNLSPIGLTVSEKKGENFGFSLQKLVLRKIQNNHFFFIFFSFFFFYFCLF